MPISSSGRSQSSSSSTTELSQLDLECCQIPKIHLFEGDHPCSVFQSPDNRRHSGTLTEQSTQVIDPEFSFYGPMGFDIGAFTGNLILAFFSQDGHAKEGNDRKAYKEWILSTIEETWNLFHKKFVALWDDNKDGSGEAYLPGIYNNDAVRQLVQKKYLKDLFHNTLGFGAAKMIRRTVGVAHVEDFESIAYANKRAECERKALNLAKTLLKERRKFQSIDEVVLAIRQIQS